MSPEETTNASDSENEEEDIDDKSNVTLKPEKRANIDGGYGWIVATGSFVIIAIIGGIIDASGVFLTEFSQYYGNSRKSKIALKGAALNAFFLLIGN